MTQNEKIKKKAFYGIVPKNYKPSDMYVLLLSPNKETARRLYEMWNDNFFKCTDQYMDDAQLKFRKVLI